MVMFKRLLFVLPTFLLLMTQGFGANNGVQPFQEGPIHEAYITKEFGQIILDAVPEQPPEVINEQIPPQSDQQTQWIPGYWSWSKDRSDFVWVSGVWRRAPPGHQWIGGHWNQFDEGWVWLNGFWSETSESALKYIEEPPPNQIDERLPASPGSDYFWMKGYWSWNASQSKYVWYGGRWEKFDPNWIYVPAHYTWREDGYVFIPGYWDWPLDARGTAFAAAIIEPAMRSVVVYEPALIIDPFVCIQIYYAWWPDYLFLYHYYFHYHVDFWISWGAAPPWWWWDSWWGFSWHDSWWLFWWWGHPGFPHPFWLEMEFAAMMAPPPGFLLSLLSQVLPPPIVLADGVVGPDELLDAINEVTGGDEGPIMPSDEDEVEEIQEEATPEETPERPYLKPTGPAPDTETAPDKPNFGPENGDLQVPPQVLKPPVKPTVPSRTVKPPRKPRPPIRQVQPRPSRPTSPPSYGRPSQPPTYQPSRPRRPRPPTYRPTPRPRPEYTPPSRPPSYTPPSHTPSRPPSYTPSRPPSYTPPSSTQTPESEYTPPSTTRPPSYTPSRPPSYTPSRPPSYTPSRPPSYTPSRSPRYTPPSTSRQPSYTPQRQTPSSSRIRPQMQMRQRSNFQSSPRYQPRTQTRPPSTMY